MSNLTVLSFSTPQGAQDISELMWAADEDGLIEIEDMAIVRRDSEGPPKMWQTVQPDSGRRSMLSGAFWGLTLGTLFVMPLAGAATGVAAGLASGHVDFGIDDEFIEQVRDQLEPNTSALFLLGVGHDIEALRDRLPTIDFEIRSTELEPAREAELRAMFAQD